MNVSSEIGTPPPRHPITRSFISDSVMRSADDFSEGWISVVRPVLLVFLSLCMLPPSLRAPTCIVGDQTHDAPLLLAR